MALVRPSLDSLNGLVAVFQEKVELLQKLAVLYGSADVDDAFLNDVETEVRALETCINQVKQHVAADEDIVAKTRDLIIALTVQQNKARLLDQHLPAHLAQAHTSSRKRAASQLDDKPTVESASKLATKGDHKAGKLVSIPLPTPAAFEAVPKYVKGRLAYEKFLEVSETLMNAFNHKYQVLATKVTSMSDATLRKFNVFKEQESDVGDGSKFLSTAEFKALDLVLDAPTKGVLGVLKHTNALKVHVAGGVTRYTLAD